METKPDFSYEIKIAVPFSLSEAEFLVRQAEHHYDGHCRSVAKEGFLRGILNYAMALAEDGQPCTWDMDTRMLGTLGKILEMPVMPSTEPLLALSSQLRTRFQQSFAAIQEEYNRIKENDGNPGELIAALRLALSTRANHTEECRHTKLSIGYNKGWSSPPEDDGSDCDCGLTALLTTRI